MTAALPPPRLQWRYGPTRVAYSSRPWDKQFSAAASLVQSSARCGRDDLIPKAKLESLEDSFVSKWLSDSGYLIILIGFHDLSCQLSYLLGVAAESSSSVSLPCRLELIDVTIDPPPELQLPTPAPVTVQAVPVPAVPAAGFTSLECTRQGDLTLFWHHCWLFIFLHISIYTHMRTHTHMHAYVCIYDVFDFICVLIFLKILISDSWYSHTRTYPEIIAIHICPLATNQAMDNFFRFVGDFPLPFSLATGYQGTHGVLCKTIQNPKCLKEVCRRLHSSSLLFFFVYLHVYLSSSVIVFVRGIYWLLMGRIDKRMFHDVSVYMCIYKYT